MKIYFTSQKRAALKLNGQFLGWIDGVERFVQIQPKQTALAEIFPMGEYSPLHFFIDEDSLLSPPPFLNIFIMPDGYAVHVKKYRRNTPPFKLLTQAPFNGFCVTLFCLNGIEYASYDGKNCHLYELGEGFENAKPTVCKISGYDCVEISSPSGYCLLSSGGKKLYLGNAKGCCMGDMLQLTQNFISSVGYFAKQEYTFDGNSLTLCKQTISYLTAPTSQTYHLAFFEGLNIGFDCKQFLSEELYGQTAAIKEYLGEYSAVLPPSACIDDIYGKIKGAALAYPIKENLFNIKYYAVEEDNGKIANIKMAEPK